MQRCADTATLVNLTSCSYLSKVCWVGWLPLHKPNPLALLLLTLTKYMSTLFYWPSLVSSQSDYCPNFTKRIDVLNCYCCPVWSDPPHAFCNLSLVQDSRSYISVTQCYKRLQLLAKSLLQELCTFLHHQVDRFTLFLQLRLSYCTHPNPTKDNHIRYHGTPVARYIETCNDAAANRI